MMRGFVKYLSAGVLLWKLMLSWDSGIWFYPSCNPLYSATNLWFNEGLIERLRLRTGPLMWVPAFPVPPTSLGALTVSLKVVVETISWWSRLCVCGSSSSSFNAHLCPVQPGVPNTSFPLNSFSGKTMTSLLIIWPFTELDSHSLWSILGDLLKHKSVGNISQNGVHSLRQNTW